MKKLPYILYFRNIPKKACNTLSTRYTLINQNL
ncbi:hypothetical protein HMPREF1057_02409 [Bacteroides finegoldii CL09T03C10]|uniref:Uncharacterized protein n=1 Tax=Bacteroides finegoldii CL09T03C10 TaxID=997888 RepID=K5CBI1_9BACE|nr:hypothetical protein HMPREF1057_02409 [Bacteroides finegoldii CL09T03C10]